MKLRPNWNEVGERIDENLDHQAQHQKWMGECNAWLSNVASHYGPEYRLEHSANFTIMSNETPRYITVFSSFLEEILQRILNKLSGIARDEGYGKHVAMIFHDIDHYYNYIGMFMPEEGEFGLSSGMYINEGYGHFVFPSQEIEFAEPVAVHELTHACLSHLPIPLWLNEGIAVSMEEALAGIPLYMDNDILEQHYGYWNSNTIQDFWSGKSFSDAGVGQELSYSLAHILVRNLSEDFSAFVKFANTAHFDDAGEAAAEAVFGGSLASLLQAFLGDGDWRYIRESSSTQKALF